jgi:hypothetical protein
MPGIVLDWMGGENPAWSEWSMPGLALVGDRWTAAVELLDAEPAVLSSSSRGPRGAVSPPSIESTTTTIYSRGETARYHPGF